MRLFMSPVDDEVADVGNPREQVREDENGVALAQRVDQQQHRAGQAEPPERGRHHHALQPLGRVPLDEKAGEEEEIAEPADDLPDAPVDPE